MFGEVAEDFSQPFLSHYTAHDDVQGVLDFLFQMSARRLRRPLEADRRAEDFFENDDWYTDGDSNVYNLPTFLGNHDRGRIGMFLRNANPGAPSPSCWPATSSRTRSCTSRAATRSSTTATSRASRARAATRTRARTCSRRRARSTTTSATTRSRRRRRRGQERQHRLGRDADGRQLRPRPPALPRDRRLPDVTQRHRRCATAPSSTGSRRRRAGVYAFSRIDRSRKHEYVVALNNAEQAAPGVDADLRGRTASGRRSTATARSGCARARQAPRRLARRRSRRSSTAPRSTSRAAEGAADP